MKTKDWLLYKIRRVLGGGVNIDKLKKKKGLTVGENCWFGNGVFIDPTFCCLIKIGDGCTVTSNAHILAHDASTKKILGYTKIGRVCIGRSVFIGANVTVLPGVSIGDNSIIAAGSIVTDNVPADEVWGGNPARRICSLNDFKAKHEHKDYYSQSALKGLSEKERESKLRELTSSGIAYIE